MPTAVRSRTMEEFENAGRALITNARCLTEGVDVPNIDCVLFADPRRSTIDIVQAVGRALRTAEGKNCGYVVIPVLIDREGNDAEAFQQSSFDSVLQVLRALAANDERIVEYFRTIAAGSKRRPSHAKFEIEIPDGLVIDTDAFVSSVELRFWSRLAKLSWRPFAEAREFVRQLGLKSLEQWEKYCRGELPGHKLKPDDIPAYPYGTYKDKGWTSVGDWLGTGTVANQLREFRPFGEARAFARKLGLRDREEWKKYCSGKLPDHDAKPDDIPVGPYGVYANDGWTSWGDWLGTGTVAPGLRQFKPFRIARAFVRGLGLQSKAGWNKYCKGELPGHAPRPGDIPANPQGAYKDKGWVSWGDWFGTRTVAPWLRQLWPFEKARAFVRRLGLENGTHWKKYCNGEARGKGRKPDDIPAVPSITYKDDGWIGWGDWLGTGAVAAQLRQYRPFEKAREFVRQLGLRNQREWTRYCKGKLPGRKPKPDDIPANPYQTYEDKGWTSFGDWLGTGNVAPFLRQFRPFKIAARSSDNSDCKTRPNGGVTARARCQTRGKSRMTFLATHTAITRTMDGSIGATGSELARWHRRCGSFGRSRRLVHLSDDSAYETRRNGKATARATCLARARNPMIFRLPRMFRTRVKVGSVGVIGSEREQ